MKKLAAAVPAGVFLGWLYFLGFLYVQAYFNDFALPGRVASASVEALLTTGTTALSVGSRPWYMQLPLAFELVMLAGMYWLAARLNPERRRRDARLARRRGKQATRSPDPPAWLLLLGMLALAISSACLAYRQGTIAARQVRTKFAAEGRGQRTVYFANGRSETLGPVLGCDANVCAFLGRSGVLLLDRKLIAAEVPRSR
jgi:hypothetical protein